jgi:hypothetical protein
LSIRKCKLSSDFVFKLSSDFVLISNLIFILFNLSSKILFYFWFNPSIQNFKLSSYCF